MNKTLPGKYYTDPEIFRSEMERFYFGRWIYAGRAERIAKPGGYFLFEIGFNQAAAVERLLDPKIWKLMDIHKDLQGIARTVALQRL